MNRQRKPEETYCNFANFKKAVDSKTDINQNRVQINKSCLEYESKPIIYFWFLRVFTLISKDQK